MPNDGLVVPLHKTLPRNIDERAQDKQQLQSKALPCTVVAIMGEFVKVKFETQGNFTLPQRVIPQAFSQWAREPTQIGDAGYAVPADLYMGGQSQDGGGIANFYSRANLTPLVFHPNSQKAFSSNPTRNLNAHFINGPDGVVLQDTGGACKFTLTPSGITITIGGMTLTINGSGLTVTGGDIVNNGLTVGSTHVHSTLLGTVPGDTGPPNP